MGGGGGGWGGGGVPAVEPQMSAPSNFSKTETKTVSSIQPAENKVGLTYIFSGLSTI